MQVTGQNQQSIIPQYNPNYNCGAVSVPLQQQNSAVSQNTSPVIQNQPQNVAVPPGATGVNIQIFNPAVTAPGALPPTNNINAPNYYPANYYTTPMGQQCCQCGNMPSQTGDSMQKTQKKRVVLLNDNYIKNLENMLNSQDKSKRITAAKEVFERLDEDSSRKDDKALTALINKMLQDPVQEVRILALSALEGRIVNGDDFTVAVLKQMQDNPQGYGYDSTDASRILLDMSAQRADKDVPLDPDKRTRIKTDDKKDDKKSQIKSNNK